MLDRLFMPVLTFMMLGSALAAFSIDAVDSQLPAQAVVQLERVVVTAAREMPATPLAQTATAQLATTSVR